MKISVCEKGGSGKSTIVALLANEALARGYHVLMVDSDESNSGLFRMLGFDRLPVPLMELVGDKKILKQKMGQLSVLSGTQIQTAHIPEGYVLKKDGLKLVQIDGSCSPHVQEDQIAVPLHRLIDRLESGGG